ncbi:hypothetical protein SAMN04487943_101729 [Gracilibacillus orientalis]|uniref:Uncharacterized protein n=1 Tax=Gracilibacillus orientalis TaxID=334253 RepID=A0A1I4HZN1_9BACI|nr:hypothetical protein [Gracilibacillus orientalis]SFL47297.1 hypothetical protein SAMN04487943_101729 [Gracilibacillus orientalis]
MNSLERYIPHLVHVKNKHFAYKEQAAKSNTSVFGQNMKYIIFLSVSDGNTRASVSIGIGNSLETSWKNAETKSLAYINKKRIRPIWIKVDLVINMKVLSKKEFFKEYNNTKNNYFRKGVSFDRQFNLAFLEQEFLANAFMKDGTFSMNNINYYLQSYRDIQYPIREASINEVVVFDTISYFCDKNNVYPLHSGGLDNGRRIVEEVDEEIVYQMINSASHFLANQVKPTGEFIYEYYSHLHHGVSWYNMLRHASTIYSLMEAYTVTKNPMLEKSIKRALNYLINQAIITRKHPEYGKVSYVVDKQNNNEIKLGTLGVSILAITKYAEVFHDDSYMDIAISLGNGILTMQHNNGQFTHILNAKDLSVKEIHSRAYYDSVAVFSLLRLYELYSDNKWLKTASLSFDNFIKNERWKNADHWLSYCADEITKYKLEDRYFEFGLKNATYKLDYIFNRDTTCPQFLELLMATDQMIQRIRALRKEYLLDKYPIEYIFKTINKRAEHQLNGYFFPEIAMYMEYPNKINGSFFTRDHSFRTRIDDIKHYISSYHYYFQKVSQVEKV